MRILNGAAALKQIRRLERRGSEFSRLEPQVRKIIEDVRRNGDRAVRKYAQEWDGLEANEAMQVLPAELECAWMMAAPQLRSSLEQAAVNIRRFCKRQRPREWTKNGNGISAGQIVRPLESVGCYVPGGRYPLVSTLLM